MKKVFGIDLGTTYSCIAYIDDMDKPVVLQNAEEETTTPSVVYYESPEKITVGKYAKEDAILHPLQTVSLIKRDMGKDIVRPINGVDYRPEEISAAILMKVVKDATDNLRSTNKLGEKEEIKDVVITCPAYFGLAEKEATKKAGELAGLNVLSIINEPTAAAISYGIVDSSADKTVLVYDLGGGTFDITVIHIEKDLIRVVATGGNHVLGGADWDKEIIKYAADRFEQENGTPKQEILNDPETLQSLTIAAESAKKMLTAREKANITVSYDGESIRVELTRDKFNEITKDLLEQTITLTKETVERMQKKGFSMDDVSEILLVGGSSKMPQVQARVKEAFGKETKIFDPNEAVAKGAAIFAVNKREVVIDDNNNEGLNQPLPPGPNPVIIDVSSRTYGTEVVGDLVVNMIMQNDELPAEKTDTFNPVRNDQTSARIAVYESMSSEESIEKSLGTFVGEAHLTLPPNTKTSDEIEVTFKLNKEGLLEVKARELRTGGEVEAKFDVKNAMSQEDEEEAKGRMHHALVE